MIRAIGNLFVTMALVAAQVAAPAQSFAHGVHFGVPRFSFVPRGFVDRHVLFGGYVAEPQVAGEPYPTYPVYPSGLDDSLFSGLSMAPL